MNEINEVPFRLLASLQGGDAGSATVDSILLVIESRSVHQVNESGGADYLATANDSSPLTL
jgi:hypothetical protein